MNLIRKENQQIERWYEQPKQLPVLTVLSGGLTGIAGIMASMITATGFLQIIPFLVLTGGVYYLFAKTRVRYFHRFLVGVTAFMLAGLMLSFYVAVFVSPIILTMPLWAQLFRIGILFLFAVPINALIAYTQARMERKTISYIEANEL